MCVWAWAYVWKAVGGGEAKGQGLPGGAHSTRGCCARGLEEHGEAAGVGGAGRGGRGAAWLGAEGGGNQRRSPSLLALPSPHPTHPAPPKHLLVNSPMHLAASSCQPAPERLGRVSLGPYGLCACRSAVFRSVARVHTCVRGGPWGGVRGRPGRLALKRGQVGKVRLRERVRLAAGRSDRQIEQGGDVALVREEPRALHGRWHGEMDKPLLSVCAHVAQWMRYKLPCSWSCFVVCAYVSARAHVCVRVCACGRRACVRMSHWHAVS